MNYQDTRDSEQLRILDKSIDTFISGFHPTAQTIIFFPGGLASRLLRAKTPYKPNISAPQRFDFDGQEVWLSAWTFGHPELNALKLRMHKEADGFYHDEDDRKSLPTVASNWRGLRRTMTSPTGERQQHQSVYFWLGLATASWDIVTFFLDKFLPRLNARLGSAGR